VTHLDSNFAAHWYDKKDGIDQALVSGLIDDDTCNLVQFFSDHGYCIIPAALAERQIDKYLEDLQALTQSCDYLKVSDGREIRTIRNSDVLKPGTKILDTISIIESGRELALHETIVKVLMALFGGQPLAFQSLHFEVGSTQALHQDTAYVVVDQPNSLIASWIALEDVQAGSGELMYIPGSHRLDDFVYGNGTRKYWDPSRDGHEIHNHHLWWLSNLPTDDSGIASERQKFLPRKGDVLLWHADLVHGGNLIEDGSLTRRSLVTHYTFCRNTPKYFQDLEVDQQVKSRYANSYYSSYFYPQFK
jgi:phytanoyl-CoA hydroxylase